MSARSCCPSCGSARVESFMDYHGHYVDYFHCLDCRHVWNVPKGNDGPVNHVTPLPGPRPMKMTAPAASLADLLARAQRAVGARREISTRYRALESEATALKGRAGELIEACRRALGPGRVWPQRRARGRKLSAA